MAARVESQAGGADDGAAPLIPSAFEHDHMLGVTEAIMWIACRRRFSHETIREHLKRRALNLQRLTRSPQESSQDRPQVSPVLRSRVDKAEFQLFRLIIGGVPAIGTLDDEGHRDHGKRILVPVEFLKDGAYIELLSGHIRADLPLEKHYGYQRPMYHDVSIDRDAFFKALAAADPKEHRDTQAAEASLKTAQNSCGVTTGPTEQVDSGIPTGAKKTETDQRDEDIYKLFNDTGAANPRAKRGQIFGLMRVAQPGLFINRREGVSGKGITDQTIDRIIRRRRL